MTADSVTRILRMSVNNLHILVEFNGKKIYMLALAEGAVDS